MKRTASILAFISFCVPFFGPSASLVAAPLAQRCSDAHCRCHEKHAYQKDACQKPFPGQPQQAPQAAPQEAPQAAQQPTGYYAAPPQTGTVAGGTSSTGIDGFALHFPALTLKLPTVQLPSLFRMRTNPRMFIDSAQAPYVQQPPVALGAPIAIQAVPSAAPSKPKEAPDEPQAAPPETPSQKPTSKGRRGSDSPYTPEPDDVTFRKLEQRLILRERQLEVLDERLHRLAESLEKVSQSERDNQPHPLTEASYSSTRRDPISNSGSFVITRLPTVESVNAEVTYGARTHGHRSRQAAGQLVQHVGEESHFHNTNPAPLEVEYDQVVASNYPQPLGEPRRLHVIEDLRDTASIKSLDDADNSRPENYSGILRIASAAILGGLMTGIVLLLIQRIRPTRTADLAKRDSQPAPARYVQMLR